MRSVSTIINCRRAVFVFIFSIIFTVFSSAQENSPYSRYGLGDIVPSQNIANRAMGSLSIPYFDAQTVNFTNPATYARLQVVTFDVGIEYDSRTLRADNPPSKFNSGYLIPSYVQLGLPLNTKRTWGMNFGIRPLTRINYDILNSSRLTGIDSIGYQYKGTGGSYQVFVGTGFGTKNLSIGFNVGYMFGNKEYATKVIFINDTVNYKKANASDSTQFGGIFANWGIHYSIKLPKKTTIKIGVTGNLENKLNATRDQSRETFEFSATQGTVVVDSVFKGNNQAGDIIYPSSYGVGISYEREEKWMIGAEYNVTNWDSYRFFGEPDKVKTNWTLRVGGHVIPDIASKGYWSRVIYRAGFYIGPDYIQVQNNLPTYAFTFGAGFPVRRNYYTNQYTTINTSFEIGARGNKENALRESFFKVAVGLSLSDIWFIKRKYD
jgi:hypothetical protein